MYFIDSNKEKPDIGYMEKRVNQMMKRGISVRDLGAWYNKFSGERDTIANDIRQAYGIINPNSGPQIIKYMTSLENAEVYDNCCIDGKWTTNKDAMSALAFLGYQFAIDILDYRKAKKYAESIKSLMDAVGTDGRIHPNVSLSKTNRINYSSPALMNIPKPLLWHVITPNNPDNILISADIKNQEPNILINMINAESLKEALTSENGLYEYLFSRPFRPTAYMNLLVVDNFKEGFISNTELSDMKFVPPAYYMPKPPAINSSYYNGVQIRYIDITNVVVNVGNKPKDLPKTVIVETVDGKQHNVPVIWDAIDTKKTKSAGIVECTGELQGVEVRCEGIYRKEFKVAWNAMTYGASINGVKNICKHIDGKIVYNYLSSIPEFKTYRTNCNKLANMGQQNISTYFGTTLFAGEHDSFKLRRVLMDLPVQGTAADILSMLIRHFDEEVEKRGIAGKLSIYYTRHDELILEASRDLVNEIGMDNVIKTIRDILEHKVDNWIPFKMEVEEVKADKLYIDDNDDIFD